MSDINREQIVNIFSELVLEVTDGRSKYEDFRRSPETEEAAGSLEKTMLQLVAQHDELVHRAVPFVTAVCKIADDKTPSLAWIADAMEHLGIDKPNDTDGGNG
jgi:hypothetical protein